MRRLVPHLFTMISALSLLLCVATVWVWVYSASHLTSVILHREPEGPRERFLHLSSVRGGLYFVDATYPVSDVISQEDRVPQKQVFNLDFRYAVDGDPMGDPDAHLSGFAYRSKRPTLPLTPGYWRVPLWSLTTLACVLPAVRVLSYYNRRRGMRRGLCPSCGYDLRAHAKGGRCPECRTAVR